LGSRRGSYAPIHPNDHVNRAQSTNDVIPAAIRLACLKELRSFFPALTLMIGALRKKARGFDRIIKSGRTHLQDATPIRLGQEFSGYAQCLQNHERRIAEARLGLCEIGLGGTAVGTGINSHPNYGRLVAKALARLTGEPIRPAKNYFEAMQSLAPLCDLSGCLRNLALDLIRIANDLRLLSSGPRTGLAEIGLPPVQPGSSIMPGKVNPVMAEVVLQVTAQAIGNDAAIAFAGASGILDLNTFFPLAADNLLSSIRLVGRAAATFADRAVAGLEVDRERCRELVEKSGMLVTALAPKIGYDKAAEIAKEAMKTGRTVREVAKARRVLPDDEIDRLLDPRKMT
jgi:fumarate hydratase class II